MDNLDPITCELDRELTAHRAIVKAIVCLNFDEPDQALGILLEALSDINYEREAFHGNRPAAA